MLRLIMSVADPPHLLFLHGMDRDNFSVTNCEDFEASGINGSEVLN
jgi:hypothetical protein